MDNTKEIEKLQTLKNVWESQIIDMEKDISAQTTQDNNGQLHLKDNATMIGVELDLILQQHQALLQLIQLNDKWVELLEHKK